jgi:hypothetical protein
VNQSPSDLAVEALTRADFQRDQFFQTGSCSDEDLLRQLAGGDVDSMRIQLWAAISRLLRLMHGLLIGKETAEAFVSKFSEQFLSLELWEADQILDAEFETMNNFYSAIQMFAQSKKSREEQPLLFGLDRLQELTRLAYDRLRQKLCLSVMGKTG